MPTTVINQNGPLPISVEMAPDVTGPATLVVAGSVWTRQRDAMIGFEVSLDGNVIGKAQIWSNGPVTHRAVVPQHIPVWLDKDWSGSTPAKYKISLSPMNSNTIGDVNDIYSVTLVP